MDVFREERSVSLESLELRLGLMCGWDCGSLLEKAGRSPRGISGRSLARIGRSSLSIDPTPGSWPTVSDGTKIGANASLVKYQSRRLERLKT